MSCIVKRDSPGHSGLPLLISALASPNCAVPRSGRWEKYVGFSLELIIKGGGKR